MRVLLYCRVSTEEQAISGLGLEAQRQALVTECERRGWTIVRVITDAGYSAKDLRRPGVQEAIRALKAGEADALVINRVDRISRSLVDFSAILDLARKSGWALVALDCIDMTSPSGELQANVLAVVAQYDRRLISQRTKDALAVKRAQGIRLGRPPVLSDDVRDRIRRMREGGSSLARIASELTDDGTPTAHGGRWHASTVSKILATA